ncbi:MAG: ATP-binding cassette domain-containing protein [Ectothiorhodospiraceae bacterium]|nr:ATP-binding cassette domain-containing protein [Chromatiales bacterium]MCP5153631.1 ATP-binding cassette domain-containing protein [Ectothiorhodospiraceae bacterium]
MNARPAPDSLPPAADAANPVPALEARGLRKRYGEQTVVDGVDMQVARGECWGLLGPNGAGKTTFLRMVLGRTPPTEGSLRVLGLPVPEASAATRARIGLVPQLDTLDPDFTVVENLRVYAGYFGIRAREAHALIADLLAFANLEAKADAPISTLSGGMKRRLSLARALVNTPDLLVLDEPTTGLDPQARQLLWQRLRMLKSRGMSLVLTTHYMEEAARLCDRVTVMDRGRFLDTDTPARLVARHVEPQVVEVHGIDALEWHGAGGADAADRVEVVGDTVLCYLRDERPILDALRDRPGLEYLHRPANLEDVFLRLTGRDLRDA